MSGDSPAQVIEAALAGRRYVFALHGRSQFGSGQQRRRPRRPPRRRGPYSLQDPQAFSLAAFAEPENLMAAFRILRHEGGPAPGRDGFTYHDFSIAEIWKAFRRVSRAILAETYRPHATHRIRIPKGDGRFRELRLMTVIDRAVAKALERVLAPYWDSVLPHLRRGVWEIYVEMEETIRAERRYFLTDDDVRDCFPSIPIEDVLHCHRQHIHHPDLLRLVDTVIRGHDGPNHTRGLDQGSPYSPLSAELTLHHGLDQQLDIAAPGHPPLFRYADNIQILNSSV